MDIIMLCENLGLDFTECLAAVDAMLKAREDNND